MRLLFSDEESDFPTRSDDIVRDYDILSGSGSRCALARLVLLFNEPTCRAHTFQALLAWLNHIGIESKQGQSEFSIDNDSKIRG